MKTYKVREKGNMTYAKMTAQDYCTLEDDHTEVVAQLGRFIKKHKQGLEERDLGDFKLIYRAMNDVLQRVYDRWENLNPSEAQTVKGDL